jgi:hypothetical protein
MPMDKFDVVRLLEATMQTNEAKAQLIYFRTVWNTDDERTFEEWKDGVDPHDYDGNPI